MRSPLALPVAAALFFLTATVVSQASAVFTRPTPIAVPERPWAPPHWLDSETAWVLPELEGAALFERGPTVRAQSAIIADLDRGEVLWTRKADTIRPVASLTKLVSSMTLVDLAPDLRLGKEFCVTPEMWPIRPGAISRFETGVCHPALDFIGAALVHSDNRGAMALPVLAGVPYDRFIAAMYDTSALLRMDAEWADPTGLDDNNRASARDMLKAVVAASAQPMLAEISTSPTWGIERKQGTMALISTNRLRDRWEALAAKTGHTDTAAWCFATVIRSNEGRRLAAVVLASPTSQSRFDDVRRMVEWAEQKER